MVPSHARQHIPPRVKRPLGESLAIVRLQVGVTVSAAKTDIHSHIGADRFMPRIGRIEEYCREAAELGVVSAFLIPTVCPRYPKDGGLFTPSFWEIQGMELTLCSEFEQEGIVERRAVESNPFAEYNGMVEAMITEYQKLGDHPRLSLHFVPLAHPLRDTPDHLRELVDGSPPCLKVHGTSWAVDPRAIPSEFFKLLQTHDMPLMIHTDYRAEVKNGLHAMQRANDPLIWVNLCRRHSVRAVLAHGARLCRETLDVVAHSDEFLVGVSPRLNMRGGRVKVSDGDYLELLCEMASTSRLAFDIDYPANTELDSGLLDWTLGDELGTFLSPSELERVWHGNASGFFGLG